MSIDLPIFLIFNFTGPKTLTSGEKILMIKKDFPNANINKVGFITVGSINVMLNVPEQGFASLFIDKTINAVNYTYFNGVKKVHFYQKKH